MRKIIFTGCCFAFLVVSCKKSDTPGGGSGATTDCTGVVATYSAQVKPLLTTFCNTGSGCHGVGSSRGPGALVDYMQVFNNRNAIRSSVTSGSMPKGTTLTSTQKSQIICWINQGAANN